MCCLSSLLFRILYGRLLSFFVVFVQIPEHRNENNSISVFHCRSNYEILLRCVDYLIMVHKELFECNFKIFSLS